MTLSLEVFKSILMAYRAGNTRHLAESPLAQSGLIDQCLLPGEANRPYIRGALVVSLLRWAFDQLRPDGAVDYSREDWQFYGLLALYYQQGQPLKTVAETIGLAEATLHSKRNATGKSKFELAHLHLRDLIQQEADQLHHCVGRFRYALADRYQLCTPQQQQLLRLLAIHEDPLPQHEWEAWSAGTGIAQPAQRSPETISAALAQLVQRALVQENQDGYRGSTLALLSVARDWVLTQSSTEERRRWHKAAATYYEERRATFTAIRHWLATGDESKAAGLVTRHFEHLLQTQSTPTLVQLLKSFHPNDLPAESWAQVKLCTGRLAALLDHAEAAEQDYLAALAATKERNTKGEICYRLAKLVEARNVEEAIGYYERAILLLEKGDAPRLAAAEIHLAWIYLYARPDMQKAESYLKQAARLLQQIPTPDTVLQANWESAWSYLCSNLGLGDQALHHQIEALLTAYESGHDESQMNILHNIGLHYREKGNPGLGIEYLQRSLRLAEQRNDLEMQGRCLSTMGGCYFYQNELTQAIATYQAAYTILRPLANHTLLAAVCYNLAEAHALTNEQATARHFFAEGYALLQETAVEMLYTEFQALAQSYPFLTQTEATEQAPARWQQVTAWIEQHGPITNRDYRQMTNLSHRQSVRDLQSWVEEGWLEQVGSGRATRYTPARRA